MITLQHKEVDESTLEVDGVYTTDYPDFCDAYFVAGDYTDGTAISDDDLDLLTEEQPELLNEMAFESQLGNY